MRCLVTGATGYIGGRLVPELLAAGHHMRCLTRRADRLARAPWRPRVEVAQSDLTRPRSLAPALAGVDVAYYLVHSLGQRRFEERDRTAAAAFAAAAREAGVSRIVYLGGPEPPAGSARVSAHLRSRAEVAEILQGSGVPTVVLRAAVIIGSGSASFEMLRYLTERLPVMVTPRWARNRVQPIAVRDVLRYLVGSARLPAGLSRGFDIAGPDVLTYAEMMQRYAGVAGLGRRVVIPVGVLSPRLSSYWVGLVTPVPAAVAKPLVASLVHEAIAHERDIAEVIPDPPEGLTGFDDAVRAALARARGADPPEVAADTPAGPAQPSAGDPPWSGGSVYTDLRERRVSASPEQMWRVIERVGGERGWYSFPLVWSVRGWLDRLAGGAGLRRGRPGPGELAAGDELDFWRVERVVPGRLLWLRAELRMPGEAWLEMRVTADPQGGSRYVQRVVFLPRGLAGHAYWAAVWPFHTAVFGGMARNVTEAAARGT